MSSKTFIWFLFVCFSSTKPIPEVLNTSTHFKNEIERVGLLFSESNVLDDPSRSRVTGFESRVQFRTKRISEYQSSFLSFLLLFISFAREFNLFGVSLTLEVRSLDVNTVHEAVAVSKSAIIEREKRERKRIIFL